MAMQRSQKMSQQPPRSQTRWNRYPSAYGESAPSVLLRTEVFLGLAELESFNLDSRRSYFCCEYASSIAHVTVPSLKHVFKLEHSPHLDSNNNNGDEPVRIFAITFNISPTIASV
jgi:hypothetical protein